MSMLNRTQRYFKCRESVGSERYSLDPGTIYFWKAGRLPATIAAYAANGVLEEIGDPGPGFDCQEIHPGWFLGPRPEPVVEQTISLDEMLTRLGWTVEQLRKARAQYGFPAAHALKSKPFDQEHPDQVDEPRWLWSRVEAWKKDASVLAAK